ncbi:LOW QUALITY PROTEIN: hypothetical protein U9M48_030643 [Paspalum notatum var. saurae]|uniref:DUF4220 domain-containing protein n=1 Tax=Paspalum notatum var. saurae TaxID=547442 RepID=A0AAQ3X3G6_PASNO
MQGVAVVTNEWKQWGLQVLVLLSFSLQVVLLVLAEFRRRIDSGVLRLFVWSAYMLADTTAIYVLGHMSVTSSTSSGNHELMAFWAPFLLLHLGGQDNITAYAVEDNQLWLRHLQTLALQVASAGYVLFESPIVGSRSLLRPATVAMFVVGVLKYGERVWALRCAGSSPSGSNYRSIDRSTAYAVGLPSSPSQQNLRPQDREGFLLIAHRLLDAPIDLLKGPSTFLDVHYGTRLIHGEDLYKVVEMQLSLIHDVFYTKAEVIHSWYGLCVRVVSLLGLGTAASLLLFIFIYKDDDNILDGNGYSRVDVVITYVLLLGAIVLEITSALRAIFSSWTLALLDQRAQERNVWHVLASVVGSLRRLVHAADWWRYWSGSMGQHNLLQMCTRSSASMTSKMARWIGMEDPWNTMVYSSSIPVPPRIKQLLVLQVLKSEAASESSPDHIHNSRGRAALKSRPGLYDEVMAWSIDTVELEDSILIWHIATDIYLYWFRKEEQQAKRAALAEVMEAVKALSNYMLFLLAARPYMLPPPASRNVYVHACYSLTLHNPSTPEDLASLLRRNGNELNSRSSKTEAVHDTAGLLTTGNADDKFEDSCTTIHMLELIAQVWVEILCYVGYRCSAYSHAKQLSSGGEHITVAAVLMEHIRRRAPMP